MEDCTKLVDKFETAVDRIGKTRRIIQRNGSNYSFIVKEMDKVYYYVKSLAPDFYDFESSYFEPLYKFLTEEILRTERWISSYLFIVDNKPVFNYSPDDRMMPKTDNDSIVLDYLVYIVWQEYARKNGHGKERSLEDVSFEAKCSDFSELIVKTCQENDIDCYTIRINPGFLDSARLYGGFKIHDVCIVKLNDGYYLIDPSYRQFFMLRAASLERIGIPFLGNTFPGVFMKLSDKRLEVASKLIETGWLKLTPEFIKAYFDGFALSFRNGLYYDITGDYSYTTSYTADDYIRFILGEDNQVNHEGEEVLKRQKKLYKKM